MFPALGCLAASTPGCCFTAGLKRGTNMRIMSSAAAVVLLAGLYSHASAQTPEQFYAGKTIDFVIGYPTGGANDVWARVIARHIGKHIPGKPNVVPQDEPGAGSFLSVN